MHRVIFVPRDASKPVLFLGPGVRLIVVIVRIPGERIKQKYNFFKYNHGRNTRTSGGEFISADIIRLQSPFVFQTTDKDIYLCFCFYFLLLFHSFLPSSPVTREWLPRRKETNDKIPKAFFNLETLQGLFRQRVTVVVSIPALLRPVTVFFWHGRRDDVSGVLKRRSRLGALKRMNVLQREKSIYHSACIPFANTISVFFTALFFYIFYKKRSRDAHRLSQH